MSSLTRRIEEHLNALLGDGFPESMISLSRKDLAQSFDCVPSQINYVLRSRFTQEQGFIVESQRGGHGYIRILRIRQDSTDDKMEHIDKIIGASISWQDARKRLAALQKREILTSRERLMIEVALRYCEELGANLFDLSPHKRDAIQAEMLKRMLKSIVLA